MGLRSFTTASDVRCGAKAPRYLKFPVTSYEPAFALGPGEGCRAEAASAAEADPSSQEPRARSYLLIRFRNSDRVLASLRNAPNIALVTAREFCFSTPRIDMHRWVASVTTATPSGLILAV